MNIRDEEAKDVPGIRAVHLAAFPQPSEANIVDRLRADGDAVFSLVAVEGGAVIGHAMFSRMRAPFRALGLGPVAVLPAWQRRGFGTQLIQEGLRRARDSGWDAAFVVGETGYYERMGFSATKAIGFESPYAGPYLMAVSLAGGALPSSSGRIDYAPAFSALA